MSCILIDFNAVFRLEDLYKLGLRVKAHLIEAVRWYRLLGAEHKDCQRLLRYCYNNDNGVTKCLQETVKRLFDEPATQNDGQAMVYLAQTL